MKKTILTILLCIITLSILTGCNDKEEKQATQAQEDTQTVQEEPTIEEVQKINLNDNVYFYTDFELTGKVCGGFGFPLNIENTLDESWISNYKTLKAVDKMELFEHADIEYDEESEKEAKAEWEKLEKPHSGIYDFDLGYDKHQLYFDYWYIVLIKDSEGTPFLENDNYYSLNKELEKQREDFNNKAYNIIKTRDGYAFLGTCGSPAHRFDLLDEEICDRYNLTCDRW